MIKSLDGRSVAWKPLPKQASALACPAFELLYGGSKGGAKALAVDTPVPTPTGWKNQGDLAPGDEIIGADGSIGKVLYTTGWMLGRPCYRLHFSDGTSIVADAEHPWVTLTHADRVALTTRTDEWRARRRASRPSRATGKRPDLAARNAISRPIALPPPIPKIRTTAEILETLYVGKKSKVCNHSIEAHSPALFPAADLPVPPYTLGAWLGDGTSAEGSITTPDREVLERIREDGFEVTDRGDPLSHGILGLKQKLAAAGVLNNKHIPTAYLRASYEQRLELAKGLMDSDGCAELDGSCSFTSVRPELFKGVVELLRSLGIVVRTAERMAVCTNSPTRAKTLAYYAKLTSSIPLFHLPRKAARQKLAPHVRWSRRFIVKVEPVESVPVCCVSTDRPDQQYIVGSQWITTHNTMFLVACVAPILQLAHEKWRASGAPQKKCRIIVFRKNLDDLKDFVAKSFDVYPILDPEMGIEGWNKNDKSWTFTSGATVEIRHLDSPTDHLGYNGNEFVALLFDEVQFISYEAYSFLVAQVRSSDPDYRRLLMVRATANPGGPYGEWVKRHFKIDECPDGGKVFRQKTRLPDGREIETTRAFIRSYLKDNPYVDPDGSYEARLRATLSPDEVRMFMDGDFSVVSGAFFTHLIRPEHFRHWDPKAFPISAQWQFCYGVDWGSTAPACWILAAQDGDGVLHVIDELHMPGKTGRAFGEALNDKYRHQTWSPGKVFRNDEFWGVIDKQSMDKYGSEVTAAAGIMEWGFRLFPAKKDRKAGINQIKDRLCLDSRGKPRLYIYEDRCPNLVRALKSIQSLAPQDPDDYDPRSPYAHACDAFRFLCMELPVRAVKDAHPMDVEVARWDAVLKRKSEIARERGDSMTTGYDG